ncbi:MAG: hypothetical protein PWQ64_963 [Desulfomicrobiaceae bacterium]|jgi:hypothetical protein|nr:hypothetical protein [Desulfomicrobiaceae bacterium]
MVQTQGIEKGFNGLIDGLATITGGPMSIPHADVAAQKFYRPNCGGLLP